MHSQALTATGGPEMLLQNSRLENASLNGVHGRRFKSSRPDQNQQLASAKNSGCLIFRVLSGVHAPTPGHEAGVGPISRWVVPKGTRGEGASRFVKLPVGHIRARPDVPVSPMSCEHGLATSQSRLDQLSVPCGWSVGWQT